VKRIVSMTAERKPLLDALSAHVPNGATSLNDAVFLGLQLKPARSETQPRCCWCSARARHGQWLSTDQLLESTRRSNLLLHVIELMPPITSRTTTCGRRDAAPACESRRRPPLGGAEAERTWTTCSARPQRAAGPISADLFADRRGTRRWHDLKVTLKNARGDVTARPGYFVQ
jgi:hypothetical protein